MLLPYKNQLPSVHPTCFLADNARVIGDVTLAEDVNIWYGAVLRGDVNCIKVGARTNIQDLSLVHVASGYSTTIGEDVTIGHSAIVHACQIGSNVLIGMGAIILDGAVVEDNVIIGAGALVPPGKVIPSGSLAVGSPAKVVRQLTDDEKRGLKESATKYVALSQDYKTME